jgi:hypothetical protein
MKEQCFDAGTIQAFLDGELSSDLLENVARHVALCDSCAFLLNEAEEESAFAFSLLDDELNSLVPTERIRAGVYQAISEIEQPKITIWQKFLGFASFISNPSVAAFASLVVVVGIFALVLNFNRQNSGEGFHLAADSVRRDRHIGYVLVPGPTPNVATTTQPARIPGTEVVSYKPEPKIKVPKSTIKDERRRSANSVTAESFDGETTYLKTIATLENTIKDKKDNVLRASSRVSFERDMAVVEDSIKRMKAEVRKNPKNEAAKQILRNSYQNKIELLSSVSERSEFMASLD